MQSASPRYERRARFPQTVAAGADRGFSKSNGMRIFPTKIQRFRDFNFERMSGQGEDSSQRTVDCLLPRLVVAESKDREKREEKPCTHLFSSKTQVR